MVEPVLVPSDKLQHAVRCDAPCDAKHQQHRIGVFRIVLPTVWVSKYDVTSQRQGFASCCDFPGKIVKVVE